VWLCRRRVDRKIRTREHKKILHNGNEGRVDDAPVDIVHLGVNDVLGYTPKCLVSVSTSRTCQKASISKFSSLRTLTYLLYTHLL